MGKFDTVIETFTHMGISRENIDYAIESAKDGAKRDHMLESLTADYRGMKPMEANLLVEAVFNANGGEFKKENRGGYIFGVFFLLIGISCTWILYRFYSFGGEILLKLLIMIWAGAILGTLAGLFYIILSFLGKHRDTDDPFKGD